jgi:hypothetical protein
MVLPPCMIHIAAGSFCATELPDSMLLYGVAPSCSYHGMLARRRRHAKRRTAFTSRMTIMFLPAANICRDIEMDIKVAIVLSNWGSCVWVRRTPGSRSLNLTLSTKAQSHLRGRYSRMFLEEEYHRSAQLNTDWFYSHCERVLVQ